MDMDAPAGRFGPVRPATDELEDLVDHLQRYRATTMQVFDLVADTDLYWRPGPDRFSLGQQLLHIAQAEDRFAHGLFEGDWSYERVRFPEALPGAEALRAFFTNVRAYTLGRLRTLDPGDLGKVILIPDAPNSTLRSALWFVLEHELHHRGQVWSYLRDMGYRPPFYATPLPLGERPDIAARQRLGGF